MDMVFVYEDKIAQDAEGNYYTGSSLPQAVTSTTRKSQSVLSSCTMATTLLKSRVLITNSASMMKGHNMSSTRN